MGPSLGDPGLHAADIHQFTKRCNDRVALQPGAQSPPFQTRSLGTKLLHVQFAAVEQAASTGTDNTSDAVIDSQAMALAVFHSRRGVRHVSTRLGAQWYSPSPRNNRPRHWWRGPGDSASVERRIRTLPWCLSGPISRACRDE